jgi:GT2 family glycosyltransferase
MQYIAILITCYNRKEKTLSCLAALFNCIVPDGYGFDVFLVDDGSTDGTSDAIKEGFTQVNIIQGNGNLFWNRGMH